MYVSVRKSYEHSKQEINKWYTNVCRDHILENSKKIMILNGEWRVNYMKKVIDEMIEYNGKTIPFEEYENIQKNYMMK